MPWGKRKEETPAAETPVKEKPVVTLHVNGENIEVYLNADRANWPEISTRMINTGNVERFLTTDGRQIAVQWGQVAAVTWEDQ